MPILRSSLDPRQRASGAAVLVGLVWLGMLIALLVFIDRFGPRVPVLDSWYPVPVMIGREPLTLHWLWSQANEHRVPLPRVIVVALFRLTGNFKTPMYVGAAALGLLALLMIITACRTRGASGYSDIFFPLVILHWGQWETLLAGFVAIHFVLDALLAGLVLVVIATAGHRLRPTTAFVAGLCLIALPLDGLTGLVWVPPLDLWLLSTALGHIRSAARRDRLTGLVGSVCVLISLAVIVLYFVGYRPQSMHPATPSVQAALHTTMEFFSLLFGGPVEPGWRMVAGMVCALLVLALAMLLSVSWSRPPERPRVLGFLCFLIAWIAFGLAIGWGRSGFGPRQGFASRYITLILPGGCCLYFVFLLYGGLARLRWVVPMLALASLAMLPINTRAGLDFGAQRRGLYAGFEADVRSGLPPLVLAERYAGFPYDLYPAEQRDYFAHCLEVLRQARVPPFDRLSPDPAFVEVPISPETATRSGQRYRLHRPRFVYGLRIDYRTTQPWQHVVFDVAWRGSSLPAEGHQTRVILIPEQHQAALVWTDAFLTEFSLHQSANPTLRIRRLCLLVPPEDDAR